MSKFIQTRHKNLGAYFPAELDINSFYIHANKAQEHGGSSKNNGNLKFFWTNNGKSSINNHHTPMEKESGCSSLLTDFKKGRNYQFIGMFFFFLFFRRFLSYHVDQFWWFFFIGKGVPSNWSHINLVKFWIWSMTKKRKSSILLNK